MFVLGPRPAVLPGGGCREVATDGTGRRRPLTWTRVRNRSAEGPEHELAEGEVQHPDTYVMTASTNTRTTLV